MIEFDDDFEIQPDVPTVPVMDQGTANEQAFYATEQMGVPDAHDGVRFELENKGFNRFHDAALQEWEEQQAELDKNFLLDMVEDSVMPIQDKRKLLEMHNENTFKSTNIRDKFIQDKASVNQAPANAQNSPIRKQDLEAQDLWIDTVEQRKEASNEFQRMQTEWQKSLDTSTSTVIGGILLDFLPFAFPNFRSAAAAEEAGLILDPATSTATNSEYLGAIQNFLTTFLATGSVNRKVADAFRDAPPEQQIQIWKDIIKGIDSIPGNDFNKFIAVQELLEQPLDSDVLTGGRNLLSVLEAHPVGQLITNPARTIKWYTSLRGDRLSDKIFGTPKLFDPLNKARAADPDFQAGTQQPFEFKSRNTQEEDIITPLDTFLPNHNEIIPGKRPALLTDKTAPTSAGPVNDTISLGDEFKQNFPHATDDVVETFDQAPTGTGRGNVTDNVPGTASEGGTEVLTAERVANDLVEGQNFGQQEAARELLDLAKGVPTAKNSMVAVDDLWQAAGGSNVVSLQQFKEILKDLHVKGSIKLTKGKLKGDKAKASNIKGANDEDLNMLDFSSALPKRIIEEDLPQQFDEFGDDLAANKLIDKIINSKFETPEATLKRRTSKIYSSSFEDKQAGRSLVRVNSAKFDEAFSASPGYVGANGVGGSAKKYNGFKQFFNENKNIEVGSVTVGPKGEVSFIDGKHRHAVLRDKGIRKIPVAMDAQSLLNAQRNGLVEDVAVEAPKRKERGELTVISRSGQPSVPANSPAGTLALANPVAAANKAVEVIADLSGQEAIKLGSTRGAMFGMWGLPQLEKNVEILFPNIANKIKILDAEFKHLFDEGAVDPNIAPVTELRKEVDVVVQTMREIQGATYNQANSTMDFGKNKAHGLATFGRNEDYGFSTLEDAKRAFDQVQGLRPNFPTRIIQKDNQYFVEQEWEHAFNHIDRFMFDEHSLDASFLGIDVSGIARTRLGDHLIPATMSDKADLTRVGGAFLNEVKANKIEKRFIKAINETIFQMGMPLKELNKELRAVQESQEWLTVGQLGGRNAHLSKRKFEKLVEGYQAYKRIAEYDYEWVNRIDRRNAEAAEHVGLYGPDGQSVGLGTKKFDPAELEKAKEVWSFEKNRFVPKPANLEGKEIFLLRAPIKIGNNVHRFGMIGGGYEAGILPSRTLPKTEGWVARKNVANFFVDATPRGVRVDGRDIKDQSTLQEFSRTIGAGMSRPEAEALAGKLANEPQFINDTLSMRPARENDSTGVDDYVHYAKTISSTRKRGERLRTLNGLSTLDDPVQTLAETAGSATRVDVWADYLEDFKKSYVGRYGRFTKGEFPTHASQIVPGETMTDLDIKEFKIAQRVFNHLAEVRRFGTDGDEVWGTFWHGMGDLLENFKLGGQKASELSRELAKQGNLAVRLPKSLATALMIHANPARQWIIQPQQLMELNLISPEYRKQSILDIPAMINAMFSRANILPKTGDKLLYNTARSLSGMSNDEFDEVFEAFWNTGLPQAVDMNSMLLGALHNGKLNIDPTAREKAIQALSTIVKSPATIGKSIGFTPAELANITGSWLFTRQRWIKNNPLQNWNTPEALATITKQAWDISHSMIGNAGSHPWQKGAIGVFLQFAAVQHKSIMQKAMSKTLNVSERSKMAAARLLLYGTHGIPFLAVSAGAIVNQFGSEELKKEWPKVEGGLTDIGTNALADVLLQDPDRPSNFKIAKDVAPFGDTHPFWEAMVEMKRLAFQEGGQPNPRFPAVNALGSIMEAMSDIQDSFKIQELDTKEKLSVFGQEAAEIYSGYNNYAKAKLLKNLRDKKSAFGQDLGLETNEAAWVFQLFGITTRQEETAWLINNVTKDRAEFVTQASRDIVDSLTKAADRVGEPDWDERKRRINVLMNGISDDPDLRADIIEEIDRLQISQIKRGSVRDSLYYKVYMNHAGKNDEFSKKAMDLLRASAENNPKDRDVLEHIEDMLNTELKKEDF